MNLGRSNSKGISIVIDGDHLMHRHMYQSGLRKLSSPVGVPTGITMGVLQQLNMMFTRIDASKIHSIYFVVGGGSCKWRREIYPQYKYKSPEKKGEFDKVARGERWSSKELLLHSRNLLKDILPKMGVKIISYPYYEADEIAFFICKRLGMLDLPAIALSDDGDWLQMVQFLGIDVHRAIKADIVTKANFKEKTGVHIRAYTLYLSMVGGHDNIPSALKGFGEKGIQKMTEELDEYSIEAVKQWALKQQGELKPQLATPEVLQQLETNIKLVDFRQAPLTAEIKQLIDSSIKSRGSFDIEAVNAFFDKHEFDKLAEFMDLGYFAQLQ